jgi:tetratricopeptide (TPR) repeat protein
MKRLLFLLCGALCVALQTAPAQPARGSIVVHLKNGQQVVSDSVRRAGGDIAVAVLLAAGRSETKCPIATVARIDFPQPPGIDQALKSLSSGNAKAALGAIGPVVVQQAGFRDIPGNWWSRAVAIQLKALVAAGNYAQAEKELDVLAKSVSAEELLPARLQIAIAWIAQGDAAKAQPILDQAIAQSKDADALAQAWIGKGELALAVKDYDTALTSFLRVPIFYGDRKDALPTALLGAGRAYLGVDETAKARAQFEKILSTYPNSAAAAAAKKELAELDGSAS